MRAVLLGASVLALGACSGGGAAREDAATAQAEAPRPAEATSTPVARDTAASGEAAMGAAPAAEWTTSPITARDGGPQALLTAVRVGRHADFDRVVLEFADHVPGYRVRLARDSVRECGSGRPVELGTGEVVEVELAPAAAHDEAGNATVADRDRSPGQAVVKRLRSTCDFEGHVAWAVGVPRGTVYRVLTLREPARLVVDFR